MKFPSLHKMGLFRKRDKQKIGAGAEDSLHGQYLGHGGSDRPSLAVTDANGASSSLRSLNFKGLKGFGGSSNSSGSSNNNNINIYNSNNSNNNNNNNARPGAVADTIASTASAASARLLHVLPETVLARIFSFVCPHSHDRTYEKCEDSSLGEGCMLCDMRDLAHCVQVCRRWRVVAERTL